jgi:hypothetical protein
MLPEFNRRLLLKQLLSACALSTLVGCQNGEGFLHRKCGDEFPHGAIPQPVGTYACRWQQAQMIRAEQDDFVVYEKEWGGTSSQLTAGGLDQAHKMARRLIEQPYTVVIEPHANAGLNEARRTTLVQFLMEAQVQNPEERVVIGMPAAEGMFGQQAPLVTRGYFIGGGQSSGQSGNSGAGLGNSGSLGGSGATNSLGGGGYF